MLRTLLLSSVVLATLFAITVADRKNDVLFAEYGSFDSKAQFYSEEYLNGQSHEVVTRGACKNLPKNWKKRALSVDTKGTCSQVCDEEDCRGTCQYIYPEHGEQQLSKIEFARRVVSVQGCFVNRNKS